MTVWEQIKDYRDGLFHQFGFDETTLLLELNSLDPDERKLLMNMFAKHRERENKMAKIIDILADKIQWLEMEMKLRSLIK